MKKILTILFAVLILFGLTACGGKKDEEKADTPVIEAKDKEETVIPEIDTKESGDKYSIILENMEVVITHKEDEITGFKAVVTYENDALATAALAGYQKEADSEVESVSVEGNKLIAVYKPSVWEGVTFTQMQLACEMLKEMGGTDLNELFG